MYKFLLFYAGSIKHLLLTLPKPVMKEVLDRYPAKAPKPLNTQFVDRLGKEAAVKKYKE